MAKQVSKVAEVSKWFGRDITPEKVPYVYEELAKGDTIPSKEQPDESDILKLVNNKRNASARSSAVNERMKELGYEKPAPVPLDVIVKGLVLAGNDEETATQMAKQLLGL